MLLLIAIFIGLALVFIEQRLEAQEDDRKIRLLKSDIEKLEFQKQELSLELGRERNRVIFSLSDSNTLPLSAADVMTVPLPDNACTSSDAPDSRISLLTRDTAQRP
jgi:hypothetical protein